MKDRDRQLTPERLLDVEALGSLDVFEVDAAKRGLQHLHCTDDLVRVLGVELDVENVDVGKTLEEHALALHHRLAGKRADVPQTQHRGPVGYHRHEVPLPRIVVGVLRVSFDSSAGNRDTGGVGQGQVSLGHTGLAGDDLELSLAAVTVVIERISFAYHG